ncbi:MAG: CHAT domain-containing protein [Saprospiraceae bacterium]|nr:CHAT domain-containing protein [Saprospiraceae bacterium]
MQINLIGVFTILFFVCSVSTAQDITKDVLLEDLTYAELDSFMYLEYKRGNYGKAIPYMKAGREKARVEFGAYDSLYLDYTINLSFFYKKKGQFKNAEPLLLEAKNVVDNYFSEEHSLYATTLNHLANYYHDVGKLLKAELLLVRATKIRAKVLGRNHTSYATSLNNLALLYQEVGKFRKAEEMLLEAQEIYGKNLGKEHTKYASCINNLATLYQHMGSYEQAELLFLENKNIRLKKQGKEHPSYATSLSHLGLLYQEIGRFAEVEPLLLEAKKIRGKVLGKKHYYYAKSLNNLAYFYKRQGEFLKAEALYLEALKIKEESMGKNHSSYAVYLNNLAVLYQAMGKNDKAEKLYIETIKIASKVFGNDHPNRARYLKNLAVFYKSTDRLEESFDYCMASIEANSKDIDTNIIAFDELPKCDYYSNQLINSTLKILLDVVKKKYQKTGDITLLKSHYKIVQAAMQLNEKIRNDFTNDKDKLRILRNNSDFVREGIETALLLQKEHFIREAFSFAEQNKSILLTDAVKGNRARSLGDLPDSLVEKEIFFQREMTELKKKQFSAQTVESRNKITHSLTDLNLEIDVFLKSIKDKYPKYHSLKYENITAKVEDIQDLLKEKTLFIEYFQSDSVLYLFTVSRKKVALFPLKISKYLLAEKIKQLRFALTNYDFFIKQKRKAFSLYIETANWFYKEILEVGIGDQLFENLIIVADGELGHLPFEAFLTKPVTQKEESYKDLPYLVNDFNISYNYSATLWKENLTAKMRNNNSEILACAASYSKSHSDTLAVRGGYLFKLRKKLKPLPAAQKEILALSENFEGDFLLNKAANEKYIKKEGRNYGVIHLAMHGILDPRTPMLSSLAFTEDNDSIEDNFLQAFEISRLKLNADLIVLSACETGFGEFEQGEGVVSLARSFMYAGVPSLLVSLWQVNDASTAKIMIAFYENLDGGMDKASALRQAKLSYIKQTKGIAAHPAFWSPFIQLGDNTPISIATKNTFRWSYAICFLFFCIVLGIIIKKNNNTV